ncbi:HIRAN domain protein [bacterium BMS3Abin09]|nr:HIRAN domain protein [bacterium BMS3Abin09]GBE41296.1 HIRAN domain protein [bacterium BMS3Bbin09]
MKRRRVLGLIVPAATRPAHKKNILLLDSSVAGFRYYSGEEIWKKLEPGRSLDLKREPGNPFDYDAVEIYHENEKIGYLPRSDNMVIAQLMDKGVDVKARISGIREEGSPNERVGVAVELRV